MTDIRLSYLEESQPGFKLHFTFSPNDFFNDNELTKTYFYQVCHVYLFSLCKLTPDCAQEKVGYGGDFVYDKAIGYTIKWKEDKDLTTKVEIKKQRNKSTQMPPVLCIAAYCLFFIS